MGQGAGSPVPCHPARMASSGGVSWGCCPLELNLLLHKTWLQAECLMGSLPVLMVDVALSLCPSQVSMPGEGPWQWDRWLLRLEVCLTLPSGSIRIQCRVHWEKCKQSAGCVCHWGWGPWTE